MDIDTIWREYRQGLQRFLQSRIASPADAEDVLQDILIKSHQHLHTLTRENSIKPWLFQIAHRAIIDFYRKRGRQGDIAADDLWYDETESDDIHDALLQCMTPFINALPEDNAALLNAVDLQHVKQKDLAKNLGISYSTLKSRVQKSRQLLRDVFNECCEFEMDADGNIVDYQQRDNHCNRCNDRH